MKYLRRAFRSKTTVLLILMSALSRTWAGEDEPRRPFAQWADLPPSGQLLFGTFYEQSEAYHIWENGNNRENINFRTGGENYGIDVRQGYFTLDYGLADRWAADVNFGGTTVGWRAFNPDGSIGQTTGISDTTFGLRYQIFNEADNTNCPWMPTLTFRAGAIVPGVYDENVAFAPGNHGVAIEPSLLLRKHLCDGFGVWSDVLYRWEHTVGADQYIAAVGLFQQIKGWELDAGYRHLQTLSGEDIVLGTPAGNGAFNGIFYPRDPREISDSIDAGFSYTTSKRHWRLGFHARKTFDGSNTSSALWLGAYIDIPIQLR